MGSRRRHSSIGHFDAALAAARTLGAHTAASAAAVAEQSDVVITMLPSSPHVETAYL